MNSPRIEKISQFVTHNNIVEIGADHGKVSFYVVNNKSINNAILTDISSICLEKARKLFCKTSKIEVEFFVGDGLSALPKRNFSQYTCIIAGMGGKEIISILSNKMYKIENYVLQPQKNAYELRNFLIKNNFRIIKDEKVFDNKKFYDILQVEKGRQILSELELEFGISNLKGSNPDFVKFIESEIDKFKNYKSKTTSQKVIDYLEKLNYIKSHF